MPRRALQAFLMLLKALNTTFTLENLLGHYNGKRMLKKPEIVKLRQGTGKDGQGIVKGERP